MKKYPAYKDSGIDWIERMPSHWHLERLKDISSINNMVLTESTDENYEFQYVDIGNVDLEKGFSLGEKIRFVNAPSRARRIARKNDTIISTVRTYLKAIAHFEFEVKDIIVSTGYAVISPKGGIVPKYLYYVLRSANFIDRVCALSVGVSYPAINAEDLARIKMWYPEEEEEQISIANYLDRKTAQIDKLIAKKERMIELLKEERTAIINQAVTHGLDSDVELKDSWIEWLAEIPKHWEMKKLKFNASIRFSNVDKKTEEGEESVRLCNYVDVYYNDFITLKLEFMAATASVEEIRKFQLNIGDVIVTKDSESWDDIAVPAYVAEAEDKLLCGYHLAQIKPDIKVLNGKFLFWILSGTAFNHQYRVEAAGVTRYGLSNYALCNSFIVLPPINEQKQISDYLDKKTKQIHDQIEREKESIESLKEYRIALISEVVTGKIDVRENA